MSGFWGPEIDDDTDHECATGSLRDYSHVVTVTQEDVDKAGERLGACLARMLVKAAEKRNEIVYRIMTSDGNE